MKWLSLKMDIVARCSGTSIQSCSSMPLRFLTDGSFSLVFIVYAQHSRARERSKMLMMQLPAFPSPPPPDLGSFPLNRSPSSSLQAIHVARAGCCTHIVDVVVDSMIEYKADLI